MFVSADASPAFVPIHVVLEAARPAQAESLSYADRPEGGEAPTARLLYDLLNARAGRG